MKSLMKYINTNNGIKSLKLFIKDDPDSTINVENVASLNHVALEKWFDARFCGVINETDKTLNNVLITSTSTTFKYIEDFEFEKVMSMNILIECMEDLFDKRNESTEISMFSEYGNFICNLQIEKRSNKIVFDHSRGYDIENLLYNNYIGWCFTPSIIRLSGCFVDFDNDYKPFNNMLINSLCIAQEKSSKDGKLYIEDTEDDIDIYSYDTKETIRIKILNHLKKNQYKII